MDASVFLSRLQSLRSPRDENAKKNFQDDPSLSKKERLAGVFKALRAAVLAVKGNASLGVLF